MSHSLKLISEILAEHKHNPSEKRLQYSGLVITAWFLLLLALYDMRISTSHLSQ
jgi:hypothetical protein